ncbi:MAG: hypothetical protein WC586_01550 [Methanoregula sp.]
MKIGGGLAAFGLLCTLFWISLFYGNSPSDTWVYGIHSGIFVAIGLALLGKGMYDLKCMRDTPGVRSSKP